VILDSGQYNTHVFLLYSLLATLSLWFFCFFGLGFRTGVLDAAREAPSAGRAKSPPGGVFLFGHPPIPGIHGNGASGGVVIPGLVPIGLSRGSFEARSGKEPTHERIN